MWQTLNQWDTDLFLAINRFGCRALDPVMMHVTDYTFVLLGGVALYFLWKRFGLRDTLWAIVFIALAITLSDQICGNYIRDLHIRLRPCHMEELAGKFRSVREWETGYCGGLQHKSICRPLFLHIIALSACPPLPFSRLASPQSRA